MAEPLSASAQKVQDTLIALGFGTRQVVELPDSTRTAAEAAAAIGCTVAQIAKSLVFKGHHSGQPILVIASGANRVNTQTIAALLGEPIDKPDADYRARKNRFCDRRRAPGGTQRTADHLR